MARPRHAMIMAGGSGTRLWPMSRHGLPKQLIPLFDGRTLLELAAERLEGVVDGERTWICTAERHRAAVRSALPEFADERILGEPEPRDTMNAVGLTAAVLEAVDPGAIFAVLTADHLIRPQEEFAKALEIGLALVENDPKRFVTFGISPTRAATEYGWVERGEAIAGLRGAFRARAFHEKPPKEKAEEYLRSGKHGWNSGMFVFSAAGFLGALARHAPDSNEGLERIAAVWKTSRRRSVLEAVYPALPKRSVDHGVMEPAARDPAVEICVVPMEVEWIDVGSWPSYGSTLEANDEGCRANARVMHLGSRGVLAVSDDPKHLIATIGCKDLIIVHTADATLVCRAADAQQVKTLADSVPEDVR